MAAHKSRPTFFCLLASAALLVPTSALADEPTAEPQAEEPAVTIELPLPSFRTTESVFLRGLVTTSAGPVTGAKVRVEAKAPGGGWQQIGVRTSDAAGRFNVADRPKRRTSYRARVLDTEPFSATVVAGRTKKARTLAARLAGVASVVGDATTGVRVIKRYDVKVQHQKFQRGWLARVGPSTSLVYGKMLKPYRRAGGLRGRLGAPLEDMTCRLMEGACIQRFQGGSIYRTRSGRSTVAYGRARTSMILAAALSQRGYTEPYYRGSKYSLWQRSDAAWCGIFTAWASHASGNGDAVPRASWFTTMVDIVRKRGNLYHKPKVGAMAFIGSSSPYHTALVVAVRGKSIVTIEGNVDAGGGNGLPRGVHSFVRPVSKVLFFADPEF